MGRLSHAERVLLGLSEPDVAVLSLSGAEAAFAGASQIERDLRPRPRRRLHVAPSPAPIAEPESTEEVLASPAVDTDSIVQAVRQEVRAALEAMRPAEPESATAELAEQAPLPRAFKVIRDELGRMERVVVAQAPTGLNASEGPVPMSFRVVRDELGRMQCIEHEA